MKALKLTILLVACTFMAKAQLGIQGGYNVNNYSYRINGLKYDRAAASGFNVGLFYRAWLGRHGVVEPSLLFTRKGAVNNNTVFPVDHHKTRLDYLQFSLPFMYRGYVDRHVDFTLGAGPYASALVHADAITHYADGSRVGGDYTIGNRNVSDFSPLDAGIRFQTGLRFGHVNLSAAYDLGLADIAPQNNEEINTRAFSLNLGLMFW